MQTSAIFSHSPATYPISTPPAPPSSHELRQRLGAPISSQEQEQIEKKLLPLCLTKTGWNLERNRHHTLRFLMFYDLMCFARSESAKELKKLCIITINKILNHYQQKQANPGLIKQLAAKKELNELTIASILTIQQFLQSDQRTEEMQKGAERAAEDLARQFMPQGPQWMNLLPIFLRNETVLNRTIESLLPRQPHEEAKTPHTPHNPYVEIQQAYSPLLTTLYTFIDAIFSTFQMKTKSRDPRHFANSCEVSMRYHLKNLSRIIFLFERKNRHMGKLFESISPEECFQMSVTKNFQQIMEKVQFLKIFSTNLSHAIEPLRPFIQKKCQTTSILASPQNELFTQGQRPTTLSTLQLEALLKQPRLGQMEDSLESLQDLLNNLHPLLDNSFSYIEEDLRHACPNEPLCSPWEFADALEEIEENDRRLEQESPPSPSSYTTSSSGKSRHVEEELSETELESHFASLSTTSPLPAAPPPHFEQLTRYFSETSLASLSLPKKLIHFTALHEPIFQHHLKTTLAPSVSPHLFVRCKKRMELVSNHLFNASQNFMQFTDAILLDRPEWLPSILSSFFANCHIQIEQYLSLLYVLQSGKEPMIHSLQELCVAVQKDIPEPFFTDMTKAIYWYRYLFPYSRCPQHQKPKGLLALESAEKIAQGIPCTLTEIQSMMTVVCDTHLSCYQFLYNELDKSKTLLPPIFSAFASQIETIKAQLLSKAGPLLEKTASPPSTTLARLQQKIGPHRRGFSEELNQTIEEYLRHYARMEASIDMMRHFSEPEFSGLHVRRLLNFQWLTEPFFQILLLANKKSPIHSHSFSKLKALLPPTTPPLPFDEYNVGDAEHYETLQHHPLPTIEDLQDILKFSLQQARCEEGFTPANSPTTKAFCLKKVDTHKERISTLMNRQITILEQLLPSL